jgi:1,4-dihydroxy-2-naphthoate octaprenyltransferase|tara:strand:- start:1192 stop:2037 length:846 start_codon:yes stop_codon:yes gene_type:complete
LLASVIAVSLGLSLTWWNSGSIDIFQAILTMSGVIALHASVDLLNDYWDFKRGIDTKTKRTSMSGGTGVLPDGLLKPKSVYNAGILFLVIGGLIGGYFVVLHGVVIGVILTFAIISIYFYSTKIVNWGLAEIFVAIKGTLIVMGTYYIQNSDLTDISIMSGIVVGSLSSLVLFVTSFPDHDADKEKGRRTLVILLGRKNATSIYYIFPIVSYGVIIGCVIMSMIPVFCLISLVAIPVAINSIKKLKSSISSEEKIIPAMSSTLLFSRLAGTLFVIGFLIGY